MIEQSSCNANWIDAKAKEFRSDPIIVEKVIRALILLESIQKLNLKFIFKGGTALMLMVPEPRRFSIDIDIIIEDKKQDIESILDGVVKTTDFTRWEEHKRIAKSTIEKTHYKLFYKPETRQSGTENNILLDIVFEENPYANTKKTEVSHFLASEKGESNKVVTPTLHAILGDKLTAYGPDTTGVPLAKPKEVLKQIYDINNIFDKIDTLEGVRENFLKVAEGELIYKGFKPTDFQLIIDDIIKHSYNFCHRTTDYRVGVIESTSNEYIIVHPEHSTFKGEAFEELPINYSNMTYKHIASIGMDQDPLRHWEEIRGMVAVMNGELLRFILEKKIPIDKLIRYELAGRGYDKDHRWCGFEKAKKVWLE